MQAPKVPSPSSRWEEESWEETQRELLDEALEAAGAPRTGPVVEAKRWGRALLWRVPVEGRRLWVKFGYGLPPGEERVLSSLSTRWPDRLPTLVAHWPGGMALEPMPGRDLSEDDPLPSWTEAAASLAELLAGEESRLEDWEALGLRDRRPPAFAAAVEELLLSPVLAPLGDEALARFSSLARRQAAGYASAYSFPTTLVPQDSGCCNIRLTPSGPLFYDWADVVLGHPTFSLDRLLDQVPKELQAPVIAAFASPLDLSLSDIQALRRANVLHEMLRYHDELAYIPPDAPSHKSLARSVRNQAQVLLDHEAKKAK